MRHSCHLLLTYPRLIALTLSLAISLNARAENPIQPRNINFDSEQQIPAVLDEVDDGSSSGESDGAGEFVVAPLPSRSPLLGWTLTVPAMYIYRPTGMSEKNTPWITGAAGMYTEDGGWGAGLFQKMSLSEDKWRLFGAAFYADLDYRFFGIGGNPNTSIPIEQEIGIVMIQALRQVIPNLYIGARLSSSQSEVSLDVDEGLLPPDIGLPEIGIDIDLVTLAPSVRFDSRDSDFYPTAGTFTEVSVGLARDWLGSDRDYEKYKAGFNDYRSLSTHGVLATRVATQYLTGDAPFFVYPAFGAGGDLRGYDTGTYRDRFLFAAQTEYRHRFRERIGAVVFGGIGTTGSSFAEWDKSLWSVGAGFRWVIAPRNNVSLRIDVARGRDETQYYIGLGEAF